jgi:putative ABC transport system permease protein
VPHIYVALGQFAPVNAVVFLRGRGDVAQIGAAVQHEVESIDPNIPVHSVISMDQIIARSVANRRFALELLGIFAAVALLLAAVGIYGVMSYSFSQRAREVGIRVALGAQRSDILFMALGEGMRTVVIGLAIGLAMAAGVTRIFRSMLFEVGPADPTTFVFVSAILAGAALLACTIPARRATRLDSVVALRND